MSSVRVLYDFQAEDANELSVMTGETLSVLNPNMFDGWIQVKNSHGAQGIVPLTYVEYVNSASHDDDDIPPPPSSSGSYGFGSTAAASTAASTASSSAAWGLPTPAPTYVNANSGSYLDSYQTQMNQDPPSYTPSSFDFDPFGSSTNTTNTTTTHTTTTITNASFIRDDLDDFFGGTGGGSRATVSSTTTTSTTSPTTPNMPPASSSTTFNPYSSDKKNSVSQSTSRANTNRNFDDDDSEFSEEDSPAAVHNSSVQRTNSTTLNSSTMNASSSAGTIGKSKVKNTFGLEAFLLRGPIKNVLDSDRFSSIILNEQRMSFWKRQSPPYQVEIIGYHADKKYHGVKKFTSYEIHAKIFPQKVNRRYNHFDWLHERLIEKYPNLCIPPLPGKAVTGNFEDDFIAKRKAQLELWLNRMAAHPVIGQSEVFIHFLQSEENSAKWKAGKRKAEKDEYRGAQWFCTLTVPGESVDTPNGIRERVDKFAKAATVLDNGAKNVMLALDKIASLNTNTYKKEYNNLGKKLEEFGLFLSNESLDAPNNSSLSTAMITAGNTFNQIGNIYGEQAKVDINPLLDRLILYRGIIQQMPDIVQFEKSSIALFEEFQQRPEKLEGRSLMEISPRREVISHVTFAEMNLFNREKVDDMAVYFKTFLQQQITFYTEITECLKRAYANFERIPITSLSHMTNSAAGSANRR